MQRSQALIRAVHPADSATLAAIYNHYIEHTAATFEEQPVAAADMLQRSSRADHELPWLVAEREGSVIGYAYANAWKARVAYRFTAESTIYLSPGCRGAGVGSALYSELMRRLAAAGIHSVIGGIALPNPESIALHEKLGFVKVAHFRETGWKFGRWIDVGYWELLFA